MQRTTLQLSLLVCLGLSMWSLPACNSDDNSDDCRPGYTKGPNGNCLRERDDDDDEDPPTDASDVDDETDTGTVEEDADGGTEPSCDQECGSDEFCLEGECVQGSECTPKEKLGCVDDDTLRVCTDKGVGFRRKDCPTSAPNCVDLRKDGCDSNEPKCFEPQCTTKVCDPGATFCGNDGITVMQCSDDGSNASQKETCRGKCSDGECVSVCQGNAKSYLGCGFYAVDLDNYTIQCGSDSACQQAAPIGQTAGECRQQGNQKVCTCPQNAGSSCRQTNANRQQYTVTVSNPSDDAVSVDVLKPDGTNVTSKNVQPGQLEAIDLPARNPEDSGISKKSYRIKSSGPITAHQFNPRNQTGVFSNDASLLLPSNAMGREYTVIGTPSLKAPENPSTLHASTRPYVTIVALKQGSTKVEVTAPTSILSGNGVNALSKGDTAAYTLSRGEVVQLMAEQVEGNDLTGMEVSADQKVAVFSGHECAEIPVGTQYCDHIEQQLLPERTWGTRYILSKFEPRGSDPDHEPDIYRIVAAQDGTTIQTKPPLSRIDGETLDAGEMLEVELKPNLMLTADKPISVAQFMVGSQYSGVSDSCDERSTTIGDPAFMIDVPQNQFRREYVVFTPSEYQEDWLNIVKRTSATVQLDGSSLSASGKQIGNTGWEVVRTKVSPGTHRVKGSSAIGLYAYGYDCDVSYAYPGGLNLAGGQRNP